MVLAEVTQDIYTGQKLKCFHTISEKLKNAGEMHSLGQKQQQPQQQRVIIKT
jgi:hypothetical protein